MKVYTKTGDKGTTSLLNGSRVSKADLRLESYGTLDELNSHMGWLRSTLPEEAQALGQEIQEELFAFGSYLALDGEAEFPMPELHTDLVERMEGIIDQWTEGLPELRSFILPGGSPEAASCHVARTVCRRAERLVVALSEEAEFPEIISIMLNRLSDFLFVQSRQVLKIQGVKEVYWRS